VLSTLAQIDLELTQEFLGRPGQRAGFLLLAGLLGGFLFIRTSARMIRHQVSWWPGNVQTSSGLHLHHLVWGICTIMAAGFLMFAYQPESPWADLLAVAFGIGCGLTLDEFALWIHLEDVYWAREGRASVDAVIVAATIGALVVVGAAPLDSGEQGSVLAILIAVAINLAFVVVVVGKGKPFTAVVGAFVPLVALVGAIRLGKPGSRWAKRRYAPDSRKLARATTRAARVEGLQDRVVDFIGGSPSVGAADGEAEAELKGGEDGS
jgi:lysyl-tRNA synthetase class 2